MEPLGWALIGATAMGLLMLGMITFSGRSMRRHEREDEQPMNSETGIW
jgi:hypothetical protein